jgi:hypothetical protein
VRLDFKHFLGYHVQHKLCVSKNARDVVANGFACVRDVPPVGIERFHCIPSAALSEKHDFSYAPSLIVTETSALQLVIGFDFEHFVGRFNSKTCTSYKTQEPIAIVAPSHSTSRHCRAHVRLPSLCIVPCFEEAELWLVDFHQIAFGAG